MKTFQSILDRVLSATVSIEEWCNDRLTGTHTSFGYGEDDAKDFFHLYYSGNGEGFTAINLNSEVKINGDLVQVVDDEGNNIELRFYIGKPFDFSADPK